VKTELKLETQPETQAQKNSGFLLSLALGTTLLLWASSFPGIRAGLVGYQPGHLVLLRFLIASSVLLLIAPFMRVRIPQARHLPQIALLGAIGIAAYNMALSTGETQVTAGAASLLVNTGPIFTAILAMLFLGERLRPLGWLGLGVSFCGAAIIAFSSPSGFALNPWALLV
jgi:drug/metabolite transporter (DMT)-like permease